MRRKDPLAAWRDNPFFVLGVGTQAPRLEIERTGQKLLGLLAIGSDAAQRYETPIGPALRDADNVRKSLEMLRDPHVRVVQELLADLGPIPPATKSGSAAEGWSVAGLVPGWSPE